MERQLEQARKGILTPAMEAVASAEQVDAQVMLRGIAEGHIIIPHNRNHADIPPCGIGKGLRTKINANIGTSKDHQDSEEALQKLRAAIAAGPDTIME
jgi:phosphomethylpyrimidine synthase